jgi:hypothetical protein
VWIRCLRACHWEPVRRLVLGAKLRKDHKETSAHGGKASACGGKAIRVGGRQLGLEGGAGWKPCNSKEYRRRAELEGAGKARKKPSWKGATRNRAHQAAELGAG